jgi:hypothetical protein
VSAWSICLSAGNAIRPNDFGRRAARKCLHFQKQPGPRPAAPQVILCTPDGEVLRRIDGRASMDGNGTSLRSSAIGMGKVRERQPLNMEVARRVVRQVESQPDARLRPEACLLHQLVGARKLGGIGSPCELRAENEQPGKQKTRKRMTRKKNFVVGSPVIHEEDRPSWARRFRFTIAGAYRASCRDFTKSVWDFPVEPHLDLHCPETKSNLRFRKAEKNIAIPPRYSLTLGFFACAISFWTAAFLSPANVGFNFNNCCQAVIAPWGSFFACKRIIPRLNRELASLGS